MSFTWIQPQSNGVMCFKRNKFIPPSQIPDLAFIFAFSMETKHQTFARSFRSDVVVVVVVVMPLTNVTVCAHVAALDVRA